MSDNVQCPKCGGRMWDNRVGKKNPKAPDFKCRDRSCDGVIWPPKGNAAPQQSAPAQPARDVGDLPGWPAEQEADEQRFAQQVKAQDARGSQAFADICRLHTACVQHVLGQELELVGQAVEVTSESVFAAAATLFIEANKRGIVLPPMEQTRRAA